jgi:sec-independent protein translocase protein TatC
MTLVEHLTELRYRLVVSAFALAVGAAIAFVAYPAILDVLKDPYCKTLPPGDPCVFFIQDPLEGFAARLRLSGYTGMVLASPVILWQIWRFITPGLHQSEKRYAVPFVLSSIVLFLAGGALGYATFPRALDFLQSVGGEGLQEIYSPARYLRLVTLVMVAFGLSFEFPVVLVFLQLARVLPSARLRQWRRGTAVVIVIFAAVITPSQDPYTLLIMSIPMYLFYEIAIIIGRVLKR